MTRVIALRKFYAGTSFEMEGYIITVTGMIPSLSPAEAKDFILQEADRRLNDLPGIESLTVSQPRRTGKPRKSNSYVRSRVARTDEPEKVRSGRSLADGLTKEEVQAAYDKNSGLLNTEQDIAIVKQYGLNGEPMMTQREIAKQFGKSTYRWWYARRRALIILGLAKTIEINPGSQPRSKHKADRRITPVDERGSGGRRRPRSGVTSQQVEDALNNGANIKLAPKVRLVLQHRFGIGVTAKSQRAAAHALHITREQVNRYQRVGLVQLGLIKEF